MSALWHWRWGGFTLLAVANTYRIFVWEPRRARRRRAAVRALAAAQSAPSDRVGPDQ